MVANVVSAIRPRQGIFLSGQLRATTILGGDTNREITSSATGPARSHTTHAPLFTTCTNMTWQGYKLQGVSLAKSKVQVQLMQLRPYPFSRVVPFL